MLRKKKTIRTRAEFKTLVQYTVNLIVREQFKLGDADDEHMQQHLEHLQHLKVGVRHTLDRLVLETRKKHETVEEMLKDLDSDGDGVLSRDEIGSGLSAMGLSLSMAELDSVMDNFDKDRDGQVDLILCYN